jgi:FkbM family methyltransferase
MKGTRFQSWKITSICYGYYTKFAIRKLTRPTTGTVLIAFNGLEIEIESKDITMLPTLLSDEYEVLEFAAVSRLIKSGETFLDIGSNVGIWSLCVSRLIGPTGRVIAVEPNPETLRILHRNLQRNEGLGQRVTVVPVAISNFNGVSQFENTDYLGTSHLINNSRIKDSSIVKAESVQVNTLDHLILSLQESPTFIKCDVEGFEAYVIEGGKDYLNRTRPKFLLEVSGIQSNHQNVKWDNAIKILEEIYSIIEVFGPTAPIQKNNKLRDVLEVVLQDGRLHNILLIPS